MIKRGFYLLLICSIVLLGGCSAKSSQENALSQAQQKLSQSFQTTAKVKYKDLETRMTIYKKPMNCAEIEFDNPDSLRNMKLTFYTDRATVSYKDMKFDFVPDSLPGKAASKMVLSALNAAMNEDGVSVEQTDSQLIIQGELEVGKFSLVMDAETGNILKLMIPDSELELEILNFKFLE